MSSPSAKESRRSMRLREAGQSRRPSVAALIIFTLLFLTGLFATLPEAVLGAIVIDAAVGLLHWRVPLRYRKVSRAALAAYLVTGLGLFFVGVVAGVVVGVVLTLLLLISIASKSPVRRLAYDERAQTYVDAAPSAEAEEREELLVVAVDGPLFFADAGACTARILRMATEAGASHVVVDLGTTPTVDVDVDGADALARMAGQLSAGGAKFLLARVDGERLDLLRRAGTLGVIGEENVFPTVRAAAQACGVGTADVAPTRADA